MGLRAHVTVDDLQLPLIVKGQVMVSSESDGNGRAGNEELEQVEVDVDYTEAFAVFADCFEAIATDLVPVDTGFLQSTIGSSSDSDSMTCWAEADYAEYVEYGTWKMDAQPYFTPALDMAFTEAIPAFEEAYQQAQEELELIMQQMSDKGGGGGGFESLGSFLGMILGAIVVGLFNAFMNLITYHNTPYVRGMGDVHASAGTLQHLVEVT